MFLPALAAACTAADGGIAVRDARAPEPPDTVSAAVYFVVTNDGPTDTITAVTAEGAARSMMHASERVDGRRTMRHVPAVPVGSGTTVAFAPGGLHVMLEGLTVRPVVGDTLQVIVSFRRAGAIRVAVPVVRYEDLLR